MSENRYSILVEFPSLPKPTIPLPLKESITSVPKFQSFKKYKEDSSTLSNKNNLIQTKYSYAMRPLETLTRNLSSYPAKKKDQIIPDKTKFKIMDF